MKVDVTRPSSSFASCEKPTAAGRPAAASAARQRARPVDHGAGDGALNGLRSSRSCAARVRIAAMALARTEKIGCAGGTR
jgi:hypothetical protein